MRANLVACNRECYVGGFFFNGMNVQKQIVPAWTLLLIPLTTFHDFLDHTTDFRSIQKANDSISFPSR